jgi:uncharacterized protein YydD (DUF2326 family)
MDKEIKRIRISKLYSENNFFDTITFHDGINLILGEKYDNSIVAGRKTNGVGKSLCIEFIDFCFLNDYADSRLKKIPGDIIPFSENILLDLEIGESKLTIKRNRKDESKPLIVRNGKDVSFDKLADAKNYLNDLLFTDSAKANIPSFRSLLSILMRDERSEFVDILECHDVLKRIPADLTPHLFLIGIDINAYSKILHTIKEIEDLTIVVRNDKKALTAGNKKISDVQVELNAFNDDLSKMEVAIDSFKSNEAFDSMQKDIIDLENMLDQLRNKQKIVRYEYQKIKSMPKPEEIDDIEIEAVYNQFKSNLGSVIVKSLNEVIGFKNKVEDFQKMLISQKAKELQVQLRELSENIRELDDDYAEKIKILDARGVLKNLKTTLKIFEEKKRSSANTRHLFEKYEKNVKKKKELRVRKSQEILGLDDLFDRNKVNQEDFEKTLLSIHEKIMGNKESSFTIGTIDRATKKNPVEFSLRIYDDGSHSVNRTKVFIYDVGLMFNLFTNKHHPQFLIHDNIFDVDQDTIVQCLNYLYEQEGKYDDFQYILTLNRDKIENEERDKLIKLDIGQHTVARFTKQSKFLRCNYQEK